MNDDERYIFINYRISWAGKKLEEKDEFIIHKIEISIAII